VSEGQPGFNEDAFTHAMRLLMNAADAIVLEDESDRAVAEMEFVAILGDALEFGAPEIIVAQAALGSVLAEWLIHSRGGEPPRILADAAHEASHRFRGLH
jgi:hypothetical protein